MGTTQNHVSDRRELKIVSINGSPRGKDSNTQVMIDALLRGFRSPATDIHSIFLSEKNICYCKGCHSCWFVTPGHCVIDDDMSGVIELMRNSDFLIVGSPLYFNNISGTLKVFFDRLTAAGGNPHDRLSPGEKREPPGMIMVSNCGYPFRSQFDVLTLWVRTVARMMRISLVGEFYTTEGNILTHPTAVQMEPRNKYLEFLENCGRQLRVSFQLNEEQQSLLHKNILDFA